MAFTLINPSHIGRYEFLLVGHPTSAGHLQVGHRYLLKITCRLCTCGSRSYIPMGHWQIRVTILDFHRYLQVPAGYLLPVTQVLLFIFFSYFKLNFSHFFQKFLYLFHCVTMSHNTYQRLPLSHPTTITSNGNNDDNCCPFSTPPHPFWPTPPLLASCLSQLDLDFKSVWLWLRLHVSQKLDIDSASVQLCITSMTWLMTQTTVQQQQTDDASWPLVCFLKLKTYFYLLTKCITTFSRLDNIESDYDHEQRLWQAVATNVGQ